MSIISEIASATTKQTTDVKETKTSAYTADYGKTVGKPQLSEKAAKYYESLKKKYGNMDFVLVSKDMKETAKSQVGSYANPYRMVVLVDEEKIERMAEDEAYRAKYEGLIEKASSGISQLRAKTADNPNVKGFGMQVNDNGTATFFAVLKDSSKAQKARIEKKAAENKEAKKEAAKKAEEKRAEEAKAEKAEKSDWNDGGIYIDDEAGDVLIQASSVEELLQKISDYEYNLRADSVMTESEKAIGGHIDFKG